MNVMYILHIRNLYITFRGEKMKNQVKEIRKEQRISQKELAEKAFVTRQTLSLIEKGEYNPTLKLCLAICYVLNKKLDEVFWIEESELTDEKI